MTSQNKPLCTVTVPATDTAAETHPIIRTNYSNSRILFPFGQLLLNNDLLLKTFLIKIWVYTLEYFFKIQVCFSIYSTGQHVMYSINMANRDLERTKHLIIWNSRFWTIPTNCVEIKQLSPNAEILSLQKWQKKLLKVGTWSKQQAVNKKYLLHTRFTNSGPIWTSCVTGKANSSVRSSHL